MKKLIITLSVLFPLSSFADFCPTNFNQIELGNTIEQVTTQCGQPDSQQEAVKVLDNIPQQWDYYIPQAVAVNNLQQMQGTLKTSFTFDASGNAINISVNGIGVGATSICGPNLQLNENKETVKKACGEPSFIQKQTATTSGELTQKKIRITTFNYNSNPPQSLIFEDGKLTAITTTQ